MTQTRGRLYIRPASNAATASPKPGINAEGKHTNKGNQMSTEKRRVKIRKKTTASQNERAYYRQRDILLGLRKAIIEHPRYDSKKEYVSVNKSRKGNFYLSMFMRGRMRACSVAWFSGSADPKSFRGFRAFYPFQNPSQVRRDFIIAYQPEKSAGLILGLATAAVADYVVAEDCFTEPELKKIIYMGKLNDG
tara:strand:- start:357 stop:932 length:576 start_codon:yes stop_codon:yes gene_type:complete